MRLLTGFVVGAAVSLAPAQAAQAFVVPHFDAPGTRVVLEDLGHVRLPPVTELKVQAPIGGRYGAADEATERALQGATDRQVAAVSSTELASTTEGRNALKECVDTAFKGVAKNYGRALRDAAVTGTDPVWPPFENDFAAWMAPCLKAAFPETPQFVIDQTSGYAADEAAQYAREALNANSAAAVFINWMNVTGDDVALEPESVDLGTAPTPSGDGASGGGGSSGDDSSFPWWVVIALVVVAILVGVGYQQSRTP